MSSKITWWWSIWAKTCCELIDKNICFVTVTPSFLFVSTTNRVQDYKTQLNARYTACQLFKELHFITIFENSCHRGAPITTFLKFICISCFRKYCTILQRGEGELNNESNRPTLTILLLIWDNIKLKCTKSNAKCLPKTCRYFQFAQYKGGARIA
jgi:hypothetical protein